MQAEQRETWAIRRGMGGGQYWHIESQQRERIAVFAKIEDAERVVGLVNGGQSKPDQETPPPVTSVNTDERGLSDRNAELRQECAQLQWALRSLIQKPTDPEVINMARLALGETT